MSAFKTEDMPDHHRPVTMGLSPDPALATSGELEDAYTLFWQEVNRLASQVRSRRATRKQSQDGRTASQADAV